MKARILIVEDEPGIQQILADLLLAEGHTVETAGDGDSGLRMATAGAFDLLILDVMLPGLTGLEVCHAVRKRGFEGAVLMLTALGQVPDRVRGLRTGADDYLVKPFDPDELLARVDALLRRFRKTGAELPETAEFGRVSLDFNQGVYQKNGAPVNLAAKEVRLLRFLISRGGRVTTRDEILAEIWPEQPFITPRTVDVHIAWLRQKLEDKADSPRHILTIRGEGYRFSR